jgi:hypothetical protein
MEGCVIYEFIWPMSGFAFLSTDYLSMRLQWEIFGKTDCAGEDASNSATESYG